MDAEIATAPSPIELLRVTTEVLAPETRDAVLRMGQDAVEPLLEILADETLAYDDHPAGGWPPIHAVDLLANLKAPAAIEPMLRVLEETDCDQVIHDRVLQRMADIGAPALEPLLARLPDAIDGDHFSELCSILAGLGVRDDRVFDAICANFEEDLVMGSFQLAEYGDPEGLPLIEDAIGTFDIEWGSSMPLYGLADLVDSYEELSGAPLPPALADHVIAIRERFAAGPSVRRTKIGRNDPCPCGSGKKFKKCCIDKPEPVLWTEHDAPFGPGAVVSPHAWTRPSRGGDTALWPSCSPSPVGEIRPCGAKGARMRGKGAAVMWGRRSPPCKGCRLRTWEAWRSARSARLPRVKGASPPWLSWARASQRLAVLAHRRARAP